MKPIINFTNKMGVFRMFKGKINKFFSVIRDYNTKFSGYPNNPEKPLKFILAFSLK